MKVRSSPRTGRTVVELGRRETTLPAVPLPEIQVKRILVPVDFSECANKALHYAVSFAKQFNAEILLLHVVQPPVYVEGAAVALAGVTEESLRKAATKQLEERRGDLAELRDLKTSVRTGSPFHEIVREAEETNTDLIVMGTQGRSGLARMFIGSTAERVVRHAPCPVMVVREREHDFVSGSGRAAARMERSRGSNGGKRSRKA